MHGAPSQLSLYEKHNRNRQNAKKKIAYLSLGRLNAPTRSGAAETAKPPIPSTNDTEEKLHHQTSPNTSIPSPAPREHIFKSQHMKWEKTVATSNLQSFSVVARSIATPFSVVARSIATPSPFLARLA
jgi:hypothetical protein